MMRNNSNRQLCIGMRACYNIFNTAGRNVMETLETARDKNGKL